MTISLVQLKVGDEVTLMNPRAHRCQVATGTISGVAGTHKFHFKDIPESWYKVDVKSILQPGVALMIPNDKADQTVIEHAKGSSTLWAMKYIKLAS